MNSIIVVFCAIFLVGAHAQYENGHVKILEEHRYQEGAAFGNYRNQEDGIKYKEETDLNGRRTGFWEYPDETGKIVRFEFEAGPGIGFRITNSNVVAPTAVHKPVAPIPVARSRPAAASRPVVHQLQQHHVQPIVRTYATTTPYPVAFNLFDYPAELQFFRDPNGHRFKFTAS